MALEQAGNLSSQQVAPDHQVSYCPDNTSVIVTWNEANWLQGGSPKSKQGSPKSSGIQYYPGGFTTVPFNQVDFSKPTVHISKVGPLPDMSKPLPGPTDEHRVSPTRQPGSPKAQSNSPSAHKGESSSSRGSSMNWKPVSGPSKDSTSSRSKKPGR